MQKQRLLRKAQSGSKNFRFDDLLTLAEAFSFREPRVAGSHHILVHTGVHELLNLQDVKGKAKPYQIRQFLQLVERYNLKLEEKP